MKSKLLIYIFLVIIICTNGKSEIATNITRHDYLRAYPDVEISDISECKYMASVQTAPGREFKGMNAIFVAASWVLTVNYVPQIMGGGDDLKLKKIVVVSSTANALQGGRIHLVKNVIYVPGDLLALVKVSGEIHHFVTPVSSKYVPATSEPLTLLRWNENQDKILKTTNINVYPGNDCFTGNSFMCIPSLPLTNYLDVSAPLLTSDNRLVALVIVPTVGNTATYEVMINIATYYKQISKILKKY